MRRTSATASHTEWVSLLDVSGPFLSRKILERTFPNGLDTCDTEVMAEFRLTYEEWLQSRDARMHPLWIEWVLTRLLEYDDEVLRRGAAIPEYCVHREAEHREEVRPTFAVVSVEEPEQVLLPVLVVPRGQRLGSPMSDQRWAASPNQRMQSLLRSTQIPIGLVTNGAEWSLVHIKETETTGYIVFRADILTDEPIVLRAFYSLLGIRRVLGAADGERLHELLLSSREDEEELTDGLGRQVRVAVELLVREIDLLDAGSGRTLLQGVPDSAVYNATLTVMMRLMFLLCAEERSLLPLEESETYMTCYAASTLLSQLEEQSQQGEEILERRYDAWMRLMATARLVYTGCTLPEVQMTAYGGSLFDPEKYAFLERLRVNNRVVLHVLESLQYIVSDGPNGKERRRISFEALDVEQIGYVYEGLLDHTARRAEDCILGLIGKPGGEPEISLSILEAKRSAGEKELLKFLKEETEKTSDKALQKLLDAQPDLERSQALEVACGGDARLKARIMPFLGLLRYDPIGRLQVYRDGSLYVTVSDQRRGTGTHYTPRFLAEEVVQYALEPLVYDGPSEGNPREEWRLRDARQIVNLRVADIAMGSGAFLVAVCRYLSERLTEAWSAAEARAGQRLGFTAQGEFVVGYDPKHPRNRPGMPLATPFGQLAVARPEEELLPLDPEERVATARRIIADRCLYGVDINPMATEMAKLSLWLITLRRDRPFTFLDHALKYGDSLVGVSLAELESFSLKVGADRGDLLLPWVRDAVNQVTNLRRLIRKTPSNTPLEVMQRSAWHQAAEADEEALRAAANLLLTGAFTDVNSERRQSMFNSLQAKPDPEAARELQEQLGRATFHFPLEFPDVFAEGGFHAIIGNPPFVGGKRITGSMGVPFRDYLVRRVAYGKTGSADLSAYFFLRAVGLLRESGCLGYLATNTISQGDTREVGLDQLLLPTENLQKPKITSTCTIFRAVKSIKWPSKSASLDIAKIWMQRGSWQGECFLEYQPVKRITSFLDDGSASGTPFRLKANACKSYIGSYLWGLGFVLEATEAQTLITNTPRLKDVLFPYLNGDDLNSRPDQSPSRWVINFFDWPLGRWGQKMPGSGETVEDIVRAGAPERFSLANLTSSSRWDQADEDKKKKWLQIGLVPSDYPDSVAADYPDCLTIVERLVKPERDNVNREAYRLRWWRFSEPCMNLYRAIFGLQRVLVKALVSGTWAFAFIPAGCVYMHKLVVVAMDSGFEFATVQTSINELWARQFSSSLGGLGNMNYSPTDCFETFPFPYATREHKERLEQIGEEYIAYRHKITFQRNIGLTDTYSLFHNPQNRDPDIVELRRLHIQMDNTVRDAYGWRDVDLQHDFYGEGRETRFTIASTARLELLRRLLKLNYERYAEEVAAGLHDKGAKKTKTLRPKSKGDVDSLFGGGEIEEII